MATAIDLTRPTISSAARSASLAAGGNSSRQSAVAARLAAGNNRRPSASSIASNSKSVISNNRQQQSQSSVLQNNALKQQPSPTVLKIPPLSTALLSGPKQVTPSMPRPVSTLMATTALLGQSSNIVTADANRTAAHRPVSTAATMTMTVNSSNNNRTNNNNNTPPPPPPPSSTCPSSPPLSSSSSSTVPSTSSHHQRTPTSTPRVASCRMTAVRLAASPRSKSRTNPPPPAQPPTPPVKTDNESAAAIQLVVKPTSKETTFDSNDVELVAVAVQCDDAVTHESTSTNTSLSMFNQTEQQVQTLVTSADLELACNQMTARFLAMSVVAQDLLQRLALSNGRLCQTVEESKQNEAKLRADCNLKLAQLNVEHATSKQKYEQELVKLEETFRSQIHETEERLSAEHVQQLRDLETEWTGRLTSAENGFAAQLLLQRQEAEQRERELTLTATNENEAVARRVELETARFKSVYAENDSLRAVLDLRSAELRQLRSENAQLKVNMEEMPDFQDRINQLEHQIENLEAVLATKRDQERLLTERQRELLQRLEDVEAEKRQIWRACEVLVYQLQSAGVLPLSSAKVVDSPSRSDSGHVTSPQTSTPLIPNGCTARFLIANDDDFGGSPPQITESETESILQKIIESSTSRHQLAVNCESISSKGSSQGVYSGGSSSSSPRSVSSSNTTNSTSPPPPNDLQLVTITSKATANDLSTSSMTSGCFSSSPSNEIIMELTN